MTPEDEKIIQEAEGRSRDLYVNNQVEVCATKGQLLLALAKIEEAERSGFMHCEAMFKVSVIPARVDERKLYYSDLYEKAHPTDGHLNWGRWQDVTKRYWFLDGKLVSKEQKRIHELLEPDAEDFRKIVYKAVDSDGFVSPRKPNTHEHIRAMSGSILAKLHAAGLTQYTEDDVKLFIEEDVLLGW